MSRSDRQYTRREWLWAFAPFAVWVAVIFFLSSPQGSMAETSRFVRPILEFLFPGADDATIQIYHGYVRKAAHFSEYAVLAWLAARAFRILLAGRIHRWQYAAALAVVTVTACLDEFNQSFEPSRTGSFRDVLLDLAGGVVMVALLWLVKWPRPAIGPDSHLDLKE